MFQVLVAPGFGEDVRETQPLTPATANGISGPPVFPTLHPTAPQTQQSPPGMFIYYILFILTWK